MPRQHRESQEIRQHQKQLIRYIQAKRLEEELQRHRRTEEQRCSQHSHRVPGTQYHNRDRDESSARRHLFRKSADLGQHQARTGKPRQPTTDQYPTVLTLLELPPLCYPAPIRRRPAAPVPIGFGTEPTITPAPQ